MTNREELDYIEGWIADEAREKMDAIYKYSNILKLLVETDRHWITAINLYYARERFLKAPDK